MRGNERVARNEIRLAEQLIARDRTPLALAELAHLYSLIGEAADAERIVSQIEAIASEQELGAGTLGMAYLAIGGNERALEYLERAAEKARRHELDTGFVALMNTKMNPFRNPMLEQPEFVDVRDRLRGD